MKRRICGAVLLLVLLCAMTLPAAAAAVLVAISVLLTVVAGLIPSRIAARKDPVEALRTE